MKRSRPTSNDVAQLARVSRTQVSYVMNGTGTTHVSAEKRRRILKAAETLGYSPIHSAQSLRKGYSNEFSIFYPAPYPAGINEMIGIIHETGLEDNCMPVQYSFNSYKDPNRKTEVLKTILARNPVGIFCSLFDLDWNDIELIRSSGIEKILVLDIEPHDNIATLYIHSEMIGYIAGEWLGKTVCENLLILKPFDPVQTHSFEKRFLGLLKALQTRPDIRKRILEWPDGDFRPTYSCAERFVDSMLAIQERPLTLYAYSDDYAFLILAALKKRGIRVPEDVSVLGTGDSEYCMLSQPALSSINYDTSGIGLRAVALINSLITGKPVEKRFLEPPIPVIVERESVIHL